VVNWDMPEGDTIHRTANRLRLALAGQVVRSFTAQRLGGPLPQPGVDVVGVEARGKYLLIEFGDGSVLETHMKMTGSWHLYRKGQRWQKSPRAARVVLETESGAVAVCFAAPHVRLQRNRPGARTPLRSGGPDHLGPDLCSAEPDLDDVVRRFVLVAGERPIVDALLDQRVCNGVGNVYKSEVLHRHGLHPMTPVGQVDEGMRRQLVESAHRLLRRNLDGATRTTTDGAGQPALAVYGRAGQRCLRCEDRVRRQALGNHRRSTYWCPSCQPADEPAPQLW
jgi:endonuclease-8